MFLKRFCSLVLAAVVLCAFSAGTAGAAKASTLKEFAQQVEEHTAKLESSFSVPCEKALAEELVKKDAAGSTLLSEILSHGGSCGKFSYVQYDDRIELSDITYYAGWHILRLQEAGNTGSLSPREKQVLDAALSIVSGASGSPLEKERAIYDAICARVTYEKADDGSGDKDCAIGALLNGRADCDGYSDAMLLCCSLAGIPCRYIHGEAVKSEQPGEDRSHMWNLVFISGSWLMCDVTWGDHDEQDPCYLYFNIGTRDASAAYRWNSMTHPVEIAFAADYSTQLMPDQQPVSVTSQDDVYRAARAAAAAGKHRLALYCPGEILWQADWDTFARMLHSGAFCSYSYSENGRMFDVNNITLPDSAFSFCDTIEDIPSVIQAYSNAGIHTFTLYFPVSLAARLFDADHAALKQALSESCLAEAWGYQYSEESGRVILTDVSFISPLPSCGSMDSILSLLRRELPAQPSSLSFLLSGGLSFDSIKESLANAVHSFGVSSFSWQYYGSRVILSDLEYYESYCLAGTGDEVLAYMVSVRNSGKTSLRVYCTATLYASLFADNASAFFSLLRQAGFTGYSVFYSDEQLMLGAEDLK